MPGARIGWLASRDAGVIARVAELRDYTTICSSAPSQILALAAIEGEATALERANGFCDAGRGAVDAVLADFADDLGWGAGPAAGPVGRAPARGAPPPPPPAGRRRPAVRAAGA